MSTKKKLLEAASGNAGEAVYVDDVFSTYLYEGNQTQRDIENGIDLAGEGGMVWLKQRSDAQHHALVDTDNGAGVNLSSSLTQGLNTSLDYLTSFNADGFSLGDSLNVNKTGEDFASWTFRKQPGFFDVVTYTGDGVAGRTVSHNLGSVPGMIIVKRTSNTGQWYVYHRGADSTAPEDKYLWLQSTNAVADNDVWNDQAPTDAVFYLGGAGKNTNEVGSDYVAYLFAHDAQEFGENSDESIIKCGSFVPSSTWQSVINIGFEPQWLMYKKASGISDWVIVDAMRGVVSGGADSLLYPNKSDAEVTYITDIDFHPNGFEQTFSSVDTNEYIYVAIRRPHKPASEFAATDLFGMDGQTPTNGNIGGWSAGFVTDMGLKLEEALANHDINSRLTGTEVLYTDATNAGSSNSAITWDYQEGFGVSSATYSPHKKALFRRAPGFFDVVAYTGDGTSGRAITHNLGVAPEMIWLKNRTSSGGGANWIAAFSSTAPDEGSLNTDGGFAAYGNITAFSASTFTLLNGAEEINNSSHDYIAYLFATVPGISKVGSYTGTGSDVNVNCGFSSGARFVLVKRTDSAGDWYVWNYLFGIVAGNDPYSLLNTSAAPVTNTDYIDPLSSGFTITSSAPAALNASGGSYIFLAIA